MIFLTDTKCKIRIQLQKKKSGVKKCLEICAIKEGGEGRRLMAKTILNFHFGYLKASLSGITYSIHSTFRCKAHKAI